MAQKKEETAKKAPAVAPATEMTTISIPGGIELVMVRIPGKDYWMGKFPVTQAQWEAVTGENPSKFKGAENPVENVSWNDCQAFLETLHAQPVVKASRMVFRLPTAEEWELASRAGATSDYCKLEDGTEITKKTLGEVAWFKDNSERRTNPVGQKKPNAFGLYDIHGNVFEWTATADGGNRVFRGGSWSGSDEVCEFSFWWSAPPSNRGVDLGFRLCADRRAD